MPKQKWDMNAIYIARCPLTTVVAPMGYGKTTAVNWYLEERARTETPRIIRISVYSDNLAIFWKSVQDAFARAGSALLRDYDCPTDAAGGQSAGGRPLPRVGRGEALLSFHRRFPLIVASRDRFLPAAETVRLGARACQIGTEQLRLNHTELSVYIRCCGSGSPGS